MNRTCPHGCGEMLGNACDCARQIEAERPSCCESCALEPVLDGTDQCLKCVLAYVIHEDPTDLARLRAAYAGTRYEAAVEAEVERQMSALRGHREWRAA